MADSRKKQLIWGIIILIGIVSLLAGGYFTLRKGIYVGEHFYYRTDENRYERGKEDYIAGISDHEFEIGSESGDKNVSLSENGQTITFTFSDGTSLTGVWNGVELTDSDGLPLGWGEIDIIAGSEPEEVSNAAYCQSLCKIYYGKYETISAWYLQLLGVILYVLGIVVVLYPNKTHFLFSRWRYQSPELSEMGRIVEQIGGVVISVIGVVVMSGLLMVVR